MLLLKKVQPFGQVKWFTWSAEQTPSMLPRVQFMTAICTKTAQMVAATWQAMVTRGGTCRELG